MSILNVWMSADRALVAVDTLGLEADGKTFDECSKLYVLPHSNLVIAGRGLVSFSCLIYQALHVRNLGYDTDDLQKQLNELLDTNDGRGNPAA